MSGEELGPIEVALRVAAALDQMKVAYFLGGSLASSLQGDPRSTNDIDLVVEMGPWQVKRLRELLGSEFTVDEVARAEALRRGASHNIYYLPTVTKIDLFARGDSPFDEAEFGRRRQMAVAAGGAQLWVKTPEDSVLRKLL